MEEVHMDNVTKHTWIYHNLTTGLWKIAHWSSKVKSIKFLQLQFTHENNFVTCWIEGSNLSVIRNHLFCTFDKVFHTINIWWNNVVQNNLSDSLSISPWYCFCNLDCKFRHAKYYLVNEKIITQNSRYLPSMRRILVEFLFNK